MRAINSNDEFRMMNVEVYSLRYSLFDIRYSSLTLLLSVLILSCSTKDSAHEHTETYTCPMHPTVVSDRPSTCPVCGMDLVRKARPGEEVKITEDLAKLIKSPNETVIASIKTIRGDFKSMPSTLTLNGIVTYDTRNIYSIPTRVGGRLEKVFLRYNFQPVSKGQKIAEVYSAELVNAQRELVYLLQKDGENVAMIKAAKNKLSLLGATAQQIETLTKNQEVLYTFSIYSSYSGYVISETQPAPSAPVNASASESSDGMGMGGSTTPSPASANQTSPQTSTLLREGNYVSTGQVLFKVVNSNSVWLEFNVPSSQGNQIKTGSELNLIKDGSSVKIKVDFIEPFSEAGEDFVRLRSYYKGDDLSVGQFVQATLTTISKESLWLPKEAVTDLGTKKIIFIKERGQFKPKEVETGIRSDGWIEITKGLTSGDEVASNAQYLIDSESFVKTSN